PLRRTARTGTGRLARGDRRRAGPRLPPRLAVSAPRLPGALGDPLAQADRPRPRRRRQLSTRPAGAHVILANAWIVTMDDTGTEQERGWLRIDDGTIAEIRAR